MILLAIKILFYATAYACQDPPDYKLNFYVVSDANTKVIGVLADSNAAPTYNVNWKARIPEATWIWDKFSYQNATTLTFKTEFAIPGIPSSGNLRVAFDDKLLSVTLNDENAGCTFLKYASGSEKTCNVLPYLVYGINKMQLVVQNVKGAGGLLYLLNISAII